MPVTIKDIATITGLSISTVSSVLNNKTETARISEETAKKVQHAALKLNYKPNMLASGLRRGTTNSIGIVISDISHSFLTELSTIIEYKLRELGFHVFVVGSNENDDQCKDLIDTFLTYHVDGLIIAATGGLKEKIIQLNKLKIPFVLLDRYFKGVETNAVVMDNYQSAYKAVEYLLKKGYRRIATFMYDTKLQNMRDRLNGYKAALKSYGIRYDKRITPVLPFFHKFDSKEIDKSLKYLVETMKIDAFFFQTTKISVAGLKSFAKFNYAIPNDVAVICFHDNDFFTLLNPTITSLCQPTEKMALECVRILINDIKQVGDKYSKEKVFFVSEFINERGSS
jgi:LacI family transcriptional regulator